MIPSDVFFSSIFLKQFDIKNEAKFNIYKKLITLSFLIDLFVKIDFLFDFIFFQLVNHFVIFRTLKTPLTPAIPMTLLLLRISRAEILSPVLR